MSDFAHNHDWQETNLVPGQLTTCRRCGSLRILGHDNKTRYWAAGQIIDAGQPHPPRCKTIASRSRWKVIQSLFSYFKWFTAVSQPNS